MEIDRRSFLAAIALWTYSAGRLLPKPIYPRPNFKFAPLYEAYYECRYGNKEPDRIVVSATMYDRIVDRLFWIGQGRAIEMAHLRFMNAAIVKDPYMKEDTVWLQNSRHPFDPRLNRIISLYSTETER